MTFEPFTKWSRAQSVIVTASEGGINYWASEVRKRCSLPFATTPIDEWIAAITGIDFVDAEGDGKTYHLTVAQIEAATKRIVNDHTLTNATIRRYIVSDDIDADAADCIIQVAAFGKLVYG